MPIPEPASQRPKLPPLLVPPRGLTAAQEIRARALNDAVVIVAPVLADMAASFRLEDLAAIGGGALKLAEQFTAYIATGTLLHENPGGDRG